MELLTPRSGEQGGQQDTGVPAAQPLPCLFGFWAHLGQTRVENGDTLREGDTGVCCCGWEVEASSSWNGEGWQVLGEAVGTGMGVAMCLSGVKSAWWQCPGIPSCRLSMLS